MTQKPLWQDRGSREAWEAKQKDSDAAREPRDKDFQALQGLETSMMMRNSSCFGRKMDRINRISGLGCNGELPPCHPTPIPVSSTIRVTSAFVVSGDHTLRKEHWDITLSF